MATNKSAALTYNIDDFIDMKASDDMTYYNYSILEKYKGVEHVDHCLVEEYIDDLETLDAELDEQQFKHYKYKPDLLAYDIYGSTQLDFVILLMNDMIDPKEFDKKRIKLAYASALIDFMDKIYATNYDYIEQNRELQGISL